MSAFIEEARITKGLVKPAEPPLVPYKVVIMPQPVVPVPKIVAPKSLPKVVRPTGSPFSPLANLRDLIAGVAV